MSYHNSNPLPPKGQALSPPILARDPSPLAYLVHIPEADERRVPLVVQSSAGEVRIGGDGAGLDVLLLAGWWMNA